MIVIGALVLGLVPGTHAITEAPTPAPNAGAQPAGAFAGTVVETMNAARYTYVLVDTGKEKIWAAAPQFPVKTGDRVKITQSTPMSQFESKVLHRTFDTIFFTDRIAVIGAGGGDVAEKLDVFRPELMRRAGQAQACWQGFAAGVIPGQGPVYKE